VSASHALPLLNAQPLLLYMLAVELAMLIIDASMRSGIHALEIKARTPAEDAKA
jgi:2-keto-3-deoxy-6-phosphogluconate aldolase